MSKTIDKLAWTPIRDRAILFARSRGQELFYCTGGKREAGESDEEALQREVEEEVNVSLVPETIRHVQTFLGPAHNAPEGTVLKMACYDADFLGHLAPSSEIVELDWFTSADTHRTTLTGQKILQWFKDQNLID